MDIDNFQEIMRIKEELKHIQEKEKEMMEQELEGAKKRQEALNDLEKGVKYLLSNSITLIDSCFFWGGAGLVMAFVLIIVQLHSVWHLA